MRITLDLSALVAEGKLTTAEAERLKGLAGSRWNADGSILVAARRFRTREANRADARLRIAEMVAAAHIRPERRIKTKPSKSAKSPNAQLPVVTFNQRGACRTSMKCQITNSVFTAAISNTTTVTVAFTT